VLRKLEKYEIEEEIGHGGMATVYRAHDTVLDRLVALKVMHPHLRGAEEARKRFHREAQSVARLRHPRVLEIYDFSGEGSPEAYIAAELLTGPTLKQWREDHYEVPAEIAACFVIEICRALEAAHEARIVHRDVKPENVLLHENRTLKLTDFGIADMVDAQSMTATGQILGSPGHMAPEQIEGKDTDPRTDLFSIGTVLYYLATGQLPFTGRNPHQVLKRIVDGEYADPLRVNPAIGGRLREIIVKALQKEAEERYQTATELREDLEAFVAEAGIEEVEDTLAAYLADPETVGEALRVETVDRLIDHGARASDAGDVPTALDYYNRVLALDEGNERVLKLIERVGMDRRRRRMMFVGGGLIAFGLVASGAAYGLYSLPSDPDPPDRDPIVAVDEDAGAELVAVVAPDAGAVAEDAALARAAEDAGVELAAAEPDAGRAASNGNGRVVPRGPRTVQLRPQPANVEVAVEGYRDGAWLAWGSQLRGTIELPLGSTTIRVRPRASIASQYEEQAVNARIVPGAGVQQVPLSLPLRPASVQVNCPADLNARVSIGGRATGRCNSPIAVPLTRTPENLRIVVEANGHEGASTSRLLHAGARTVAVELTPTPTSDSAAP